MTNQTHSRPADPVLSIERVEHLAGADLEDLCDATDEAIKGGGGFGWVDLPPRDLLERYWTGVVTMPSRVLMVARLDGVICGTCQLVLPSANNEAQSFAATLTTNFIAPWARGHGLAKKLLAEVQKEARKEGFSVINLDVRETMKEAISLYESAGYIRYGTHPYYARVNGEVLKGFAYCKVIDPAIME